MTARRPSDGPIIALDAMAGDHGPTAPAAPADVLAGAATALTHYPDARFLVFGEGSALARHPALEAAAELRDVGQSSTRLAVEAVRSGEADAVVSAGDTGALTTLAEAAWPTLPGIDRPAVAAVCATLRGESVLLDLGATRTCRAETLEQFSVLGTLFARTVLGLVRPTLGLLNAGPDGAAGTALVREAHARLARAALPGDYRGLVAGDDIAAGTVDVVVTDGFTGDVAFKAAAGAARLAAGRLDRTLGASLAARLGALLARGALRKLRWRDDPRRSGGTVILGLQGIGVGGVDAACIADAIGVAVDLVRHGFNDQVIAAACGPTAGAAIPLAREAVGA